MYPLTVLVGIDFFAEQPVTNASVFFMRMVLHDWSDARCIEILKRLRAAAQPNTRLLIIDMLLSYAVSSGTPTNDSADTVIPPAPLLNNGGHAGVLPLYSDAMVCRSPIKTTTSSLRVYF